MSEDRPYGFGSDPFGEKAAAEKPEAPVRERPAPEADRPASGNREADAPGRPGPASSGPATAAAPGPSPVSPDATAVEGVAGPMPYVDREADCVVICCSDHRFREPTLELVRRLGFSCPHMVQIPGGVAVSLPLIAAVGFLSKAVDRLLEKAIRHTGVQNVVCVAHEDCGGYKAENVKLIDTVMKRATGGSVREMQIEHLKKAGRRLRLGLRGMTVGAFFADVREDGPDSQVTFEEVSLERR